VYAVAINKSNSPSYQAGRLNQGGGLCVTFLLSCVRSENRSFGQGHLHISAKCCLQDRKK